MPNETRDESGYLREKDNGERISPRMKSSGKYFQQLNRISCSISKFSFSMAIVNLRNVSMS